MLKKFTNKIDKRKKSELKVTPGEHVRDRIINAAVQAAQESAYVAGNNTDKVVKIADNLGNIIERGTELVGGVEGAQSFGKIAFKTTKDLARGDSVCTGLCLVAGTCEAVAVCCSTIKIIPFRGRIYVGAKILSKGCMSYRNACAGEGC